MEAKAQLLRFCTTTLGSQTSLAVSISLIQQLAFGIHATCTAIPKIFFFLFQNVKPQQGVSFYKQGEVHLRAMAFNAAPVAINNKA